jgi:hypothetical protein
MSLLIMLTISIQISLLRLAPIKMSQRLMILSQLFFCSFVGVVNTGIIDTSAILGFVGFVGFVGFFGTQPHH